MKSFQRFSLIALLAAAASAQSFNIDTNRTTGSGNGVPAAAYGGDAGQGGTWNGILPTASGAIALTAIDGSATGVTVTRTGSTLQGSDSVSGAGIDYGKLLWDYGYAQGTGQSITYAFNGLAPGIYRAFIYAALPGASGVYNSGFGNVYHVNHLAVTVNNIYVGGDQTSGAITANVMQRGVTHGEVVFTVGAGATVKITSSPDASNSLGIAALNGVQLVHYTGNRLYVNDDAPGLNTGFSWTNALTSLQEALAIARASNGQIQEIWVATGTYRPGTGTNRAASFELVDGVKLYGGFAGNEQTLAQRPFPSQSTLSGVNPNGFTRVYHVVTAHGTSSATLFDGFFVTGGNADIGDFFGGGFYALNSSAVIRNSQFWWNDAYLGGGVSFRCDQGQIEFPVIENCNFFRNTASGEGGGIYWEGEDGFIDARLSVVNCLFQENKALNNDGGAITFGGDGIVTNSRFDANSSDQGHGGAIQLKATDTAVDVTHSTFVVNNSALSGSAIWVMTGTTMTVRNSIVQGSPISVPGTPSLIASQVVGQPVVSYSCVQTAGSTPFAGTGNINADPMFSNLGGYDGIVGTLDDDLRIADFSPCMDAGSPSAFILDISDIDRDGNFAEPMPYDAASQPRRVDGNGDEYIVPDMGAYEVQGGPFNHTLPGTSEDFVLYSGIGQIVPVVGYDVLTPVPGDLVKLRLSSPQQQFFGHLFFLGAQLIPTSSPFPSLPGYPELHLNDQGGFLVSQGLVGMAPVDFTFFVPANLTGFTAILQGVVLDPAAQNGIFAATDAHQVIF